MRARQVSLMVKRRILHEAVVKKSIPGSLLFTIQIPAKYGRAMIRVEKIKIAGPDRACTILKQSLHLQAPFMNIIIEPVPAGIGFCNQRVKPGFVGRDRLPLVVIKLFNFLTICDEGDKQKTNKKTSFHSRKVQIFLR